MNANQKLHDMGQVGIAVAQRTYAAYQGLFQSPRWERIFQLRRSAAAFALGEHRHERFAAFR